MITLVYRLLIMLNLYSMRKLSFVLLNLLVALVLYSCVLSEADEPTAIYGLVTDSSGSGMGNVSVQVKTETGEWAVNTSSDGKYIINMPSGGTGFIVYSKEGYTTQIKRTALVGGEHKKYDTRMNTFSEDAYFKVNVSDCYVKNNAGKLFPTIKTNVNFEIECKDDWIKCSNEGNNLTIEYTENQEPVMRTGTIALKAQYGLSATIKVNQVAGPVLKLIDYIGKENKTDIFTADPFISFNREVKLLSAKSSYGSVDLTPAYSSEKSTISFPNLKIPLFSPVNISYKVQSTDTAVVEGNFELKAYLNSKNNRVICGQKLILTKDEKNFWLLTHDYTTSTLIQYSTENLAETKSINWKKDQYSDCFYNRYNNCLYIVNNYSSDSSVRSKIDLYDATTGEFVRQIQLFSVADLAFAENGLGITFKNGQIYYIDSARDHDYGVIPTDKSYYDPYHGNLLVKYVTTCDHGKMFVMTDYNSIQNVVTLDAYTKELKHYKVNTSYYAVSDSYSGIILGDPYGNKIYYIDFKTNEQRSISTDFAGWNAGILQTGDKYPTIITSSLEIISFQDGRKNKLQYLNGESNNFYNMQIAPKVNKILITNDKLYLFDLDKLSKMYNKLYH